MQKTCRIFFFPCLFFRCLKLVGIWILGDVLRRQTTNNFSISPHGEMRSFFRLKDGVSGFGGVSAPLKWPDMFKEIHIKSILGSSKFAKQLLQLDCRKNSRYPIVASGIWKIPCMFSLSPQKKSRWMIFASHYFVPKLSPWPKFLWDREVTFKIRWHPMTKNPWSVISIAKSFFFWRGFSLHTTASTHASRMGESLILMNFDEFLVGMWWFRVNL